MFGRIILAALWIREHRDIAVETERKVVGLLSKFGQEVDDGTLD